MCRSEDQVGDPPQVDGNLLGVRAQGHPKLGLNHFLLARERRLPPPLVSGVRPPLALPALPPSRHILILNKVPILTQ